MKQSPARSFPVLVFAIIALPASFAFAQTSTSQANQSQISADRLALNTKIKSIRQQVLTSNAQLNATETTLLSQLATLKIGSSYVPRRSYYFTRKMVLS